MIRVLFVGSNPAIASKTGEAFDPDTKSGRTVREWTARYRLPIEPSYINVSDDVTPDNRPLSAKQIELGLPRLQRACRRSDRVIGLGRTAWRALDKLGVKHMKFPHPSGLNREWNCPTSRRAT